MRRTHFIRNCLPRLCLFAVLSSAALAAHAQGCSMCRDTTAGSAPQLRAGLRRAIPVLAVPAIALFVGFFFIARRTDAWHRLETDTWHRSEERQPIGDDR